ncbi:proteasome subunit alpha [Rhodococcus sp. NPDC127528]|uniref:proteasome subunit alpha n=1 Tax=unclassified Rhodococcus (in: high G+C Gram-positive bacteria) TaxID=192944 RepID=UPI00363FA266
MTLPYYASAEQIMRDRSELARKGIARGRSVVVLTYADGVLFVAENPSSSLHKVSELYDRLGFAAVGKYNEFENLRRAGIMHADMRGYSYDRRDVTGRSIANAYAQTLGTIFTEQPKPYEVELCVAEVGRPEQSRHAQLYRITYDGSIVDEQQFVVMGGATEPIATVLKESYQPELPLAGAVEVAVNALQVGTAVPGNGESERRVIGVQALEVAVLDQSRPRRAFRRITGGALESLLPKPAAPAKSDGDTESGPAAEGDFAANGEPGQAD